MRAPVYFDYAATTPVDPRVAQKMSECLMAEGNFGNPASRSHKFGWEAEEAVELRGSRLLICCIVIREKLSGHQALPNLTIWLLKGLRSSIRPVESTL